MPSYLIAGASRGIGFGLVEKGASLPDTTVIYAGIRNPSGFSYSNEKVRPITLDLNSQCSVDAAVDKVKDETGSLDVLIISAGVAIGSYTYLASVEDLQQSVDTNIVGAFRVIIAFLPLTRAGTVKKIILLGTAGASFAVGMASGKMGLPLGTYGISKAGAHFLMASLGVELAKEGILTASVHPGITQTDMARERAAHTPQDALENLEQMGFVPITMDESTSAILKVVEELDAEKSGMLMTYKDDEVQILPF